MAQHFDQREEVFCPQIGGKEMELPNPAYWRSPREGNAGVLHASRLEAVRNFEQVCEPVYTADQMRQCFIAGMQEAARIAEADAQNVVRKAEEQFGLRMTVDSTREGPVAMRVASAIREAAKEKA